MYIAPTSSRNVGEEGSAIVIVMMFVFVMMGLGLALFMLVQSSNNSTALERKDVKAFNVAESGVDAGLVALRHDWPRASTDPSAAIVLPTVVPNDFRDHYFPDTTEFPEPTHGQFIDVSFYDDTTGNPTVDAATPESHDENHNDKMWIDSEADVGDDRHRILVLAERLKMPVKLPDVALVANIAGGNGQGLSVSVDPNYLDYLQQGGEGSLPEKAVVYTGFTGFNSDVNPQAPFVYPDSLEQRIDNPFRDYVTPALQRLLRDMADKAQPKSLFVDSDPIDPSEAAASFLQDPATGPGSVVYVETTSANPYIDAGNRTIGTPERPAILVFDAQGADPDNPPEIDWRGNGTFYGVVIIMGDALLRGTAMQVIGCIISEGTVENKGGPGILYNGLVIANLNNQYTLSTAMVPNTWEEYTLPK